MNRRSNKILRELVLGTRQNVTELVERYKVQERTIRADMKELNDALEKYELPTIMLDSDGELSIGTSAKIDVRAFEEFICKHTFYSYCMSKNERSVILVMILLNAKGYITVEQLKDTIGVSRTTLLRDLPDIKKWFDENKIELISQVHWGYVVNAPEFEIRKEILKLLEVNGDDNGFETGYRLGAFWNLLLHQMDRLDIYDDMKRLIIHQEEELQSYLSDYSFFEAVIELTLIVNRIANRQFLPEYYAERWSNLKESSKYEFSSSIFKKIEQEFHYEFPETEVLYYTECLKGKSYLKYKNHKENSLDIRLVIAETLYHISNCFGIDFYLDFSLYDLLVAHMRSAVHRLQAGEVLRNPLKESLLENYPEIFQMIRENIRSLEEYIGNEFSEDEMSFMVLYFASVLEKEKAESAKGNKVRVALVCETGGGTVQYMLAKLQALDEMIEVVSVSSVHNTKEIKNSGAQMIVSTIMMDNETLPSVTVRSAMLGIDDLMDIQKLAFRIMDGHAETEQDIRLDVINPVEADILGAFYHMLREERIELDYHAEDWEDAVRESGRLLYDTGAVEEGYIEAMVDNIKKHGPYIVIWPGTALPHAEGGVKQEAASLVRLNPPVSFHHESNDPVRYVIGMSILSAESVNQALYDVMMIFGNEKIKEMLDQTTDRRAMLEAIDSLKTSRE